MKHKTQISKIVKQARHFEKKAASITPVQKTHEKPITLNYPQGEYFEGVGRRKTAIARVRIYRSAGDMIINDQTVDRYFADRANAKAIVSQPFELTKTQGEFALTAKVVGSGKASQLEAIAHGVARALVKFNPEFKQFLREDDLLTRDPRMKETRKAGRGGKARRKRQSPKR